LSRGDEKLINNQFIRRKSTLRLTLLRGELISLASGSKKTFPFLLFTLSSILILFLHLYLHAVLSLMFILLSNVHQHNKR